jgi:hypothetical protein
LSRAFAIDGGERTFKLLETLAINSPDKPLDLLKELGERNLLYKKSRRMGRPAVALGVVASSPDKRARHELAIFIEARRDHWQHQFFPGPQASAIKPQHRLPCPPMTVGYDLDGDMLFQLLFGSEPGEVSSAVRSGVCTDAAVEPTYAPLRVRLLTDAEQLHVLPWGTISYQGRPLARWAGQWNSTPRSEPGFPEYPRHLCYFPGRLLLAGSRRRATRPRISTTCGASFSVTGRTIPSRRWRPTRMPCALRCAGSTRLVYYYGPASRDGLLLQDRADGECPAVVGTRQLPAAIALGLAAVSQPRQ